MPQQARNVRFFITTLLVVQTMSKVTIQKSRNRLPGDCTIVEKAHKLGCVRAVTIATCRHDGDE